MFCYRIPAPLVGGNTRLESRIKQFKPRFISRLATCDRTKTSNYLLVLREHVGQRVLRTHSKYLLVLREHVGQRVLRTHSKY